jgi:hypothetical protein
LSAGLGMPLSTHEHITLQALAICRADYWVR